MGEHLIAGDFQSDKYPWCKRGFVPLKLTDKSCHAVLWAYADIRRTIDPEFSDDLQEALRLMGYIDTAKENVSEQLEGLLAMCTQLLESVVPVGQCYEIKSRAAFRAFVNAVKHETNRIKEGSLDNGKTK